jgi:thiol-disulfide isomerase/thioredoxin
MRLLQIARLLSLWLGLVGFGAAEVTRPHNLDYLDAETMNHYLSAPKEDFDVAVLFYAQWCNNCHAFAPYWDQMSRLLKAGLEPSKIIMGLFDCEESPEHSDICSRAGVKHYPTITYMSMAGQNFHIRKPRHTSQFGGNWQYTDSVYDWVHTMTALSQWHRLGWGKKLRSMFFGKKNTKPQAKPLPLGIPSSISSGGMTTSTSTTGGASGAATAGSATSALTDTQKQALETQLSEMQEIAARSSTLLDAVLFPLSTGEFSLATDNNKTATDVFRLLHDTNGWNTTDPMDIILRSCAMEIALDYCSRLSNYLTNEWVAQQGDLTDITEEVIASFETFLAEAVPAHEPYCLLIEDCIVADFAQEECRPSQCPFQDMAACRYASACLAPEIQTEYAKALNLGMDSPQSPLDAVPESSTASSGNDQTTSAGSTKSGWGM